MFWILSVLQDVIGVAIGGFLGHALCTGLAVVGGRIIAQRISVRTGILPYVMYLQSLHQYFYRHCK
jgi:putative Ca2+/H+ antiporter (TMEM165/GDT1 family)